MSSKVNKFDAPILVIGNGHTTALKSAVEDRGIDFIDVANTVDFDEDSATQSKNITADRLSGLNPKFVFCSFGGTEHNVFGLIEHPINYDFVTPRHPTVDASRWSIPYGAVYASLAQACSRARLNMKIVRQAFACPVFHLCSPPTFAEISDETRLIGVFQSRRALGVAPPVLRQKLHELHSSILRDIAWSLRIGFIDFPKAAVDENGFLLRQFWNTEPTHGNARYGSLVIDQILEETERASSAVKT